MANRRGQIVNTTASGGKTVDEFRVMLFRWNEHQWKHNPRMVLDDEEMAILISKAFPDRAWSKNLLMIGRVRTGYNRGRLAPQKRTSPEEKSHRYEKYYGGVRQWAPGQHPLLWSSKTFKRPRKSLDEVQVKDV